MKDQLCIETFLQMPKAPPPTSSDSGESHLWVHPHNKVKKGPHEDIQTKAS